MLSEEGHDLAWQEQQMATWKLAKSFTDVSAGKGITEASALTGSVPSHQCYVMRKSCFCLMQVASQYISCTYC